MIFSVLAVRVSPARTSCTGRCRTWCSSSSTCPGARTTPRTSSCRRSTGRRWCSSRRTTSWAPWASNWGPPSKSAAKLMPSGVKKPKRSEGGLNSLFFFLKLALGGLNSRIFFWHLGAERQTCHVTLIVHMSSISIFIKLYLFKKNRTIESSDNVFSAILSQLLRTWQRNLWWCIWWIYSIVMICDENYQKILVKIQWIVPWNTCIGDGVRYCYICYTGQLIT